MIHLYRGYKQALGRFKTQYHNAGLTIIRPAEPGVSRAGVPQRKRLPPIYIVIVKLFFIKNVTTGSNLKTNC